MYENTTKVSHPEKIGLFEEIVNSAQSSLAHSHELVNMIEAKTKRLFDESLPISDKKAPPPEPPFNGIAYGIAVNNATINELNEKLNLILGRLSIIV